ncbi:FIG00953647: hypothetical protein, partial [Pseudomonas fluorescens]
WCAVPIAACTCPAIARWAISNSGIAARLISSKARAPVVA